MESAVKVETGKPSRRRLFGVFFAAFGFIALRFILTPVRIKVLTSLLDPEHYGTLTLVSVTISFLTLVGSVGSIEFMVRKLPGMPADYQFGILKTIMKWFGGLALLLGVAIAMLPLIRQPSGLILKPLDYVAAGLMLVFTVHLIQRASFLMSQTHYVRSRLSVLFYSETWFIPLLIFFFMPWTLTASMVLWLWVTWLLLAILITWNWLPARQIVRARPPPDALSNILHFGWPLFPMILGEWLFRLVDQYVILGLKGVSVVAIYALAVNIAMVGYTVGYAVLEVLMTEFNKIRNRINTPSLDALAANPDLRRAFSIMLRYALTIYLPMAAALCLVGPQLVRLLSVPKFDAASAIMPWASLMPLFFLLNLLFGRMLLTMDRSRLVGGATLLAATLTLALNLSLVPRFEGQGAAVANTFSLFLLSVFLGWKVKCWKWLVWRELMPTRLAVFAVLSAGGLWMAREFLAFRNIAVLGGGALWCLVVAFLLGLMRRSDLRACP